MSRILVLLVGGCALLLVPGVAAAGQSKKLTEVQVGPVRVTVGGEDAAGAGTGVQVRVEAQQGPNKTVKVWKLQTGKDSPGGSVAVAVGTGGVAVNVTLSDYWLGLECRPADAALRAQLRLEESGLLVERVLPDSPAANAGIKPHDVLIKVDGKPLKDLHGLIEAIAAGKAKELAIELIHGGKNVTVKVTPAKRPEGMRVVLPEDGAHVIAVPGGDVATEALKWLDLLRQRGPNNGPLHFRLIHPGVVLPPAAAIHPPLPGNMSVTITKQGEGPAKIVVKRGDQKWEVTEDQLDKLPADVRPHVEIMVGPRSLRLNRFERILRPRPPVRRQIEVVPHQKPLDKQLDEMNHQIEGLREMLKELQQSRGEAEETPDES